VVDLLAALFPQEKPTVRSRMDFYGPFGFDGGFGFPVPYQTLAGDKEVMSSGFSGLVQGAYQSSGIVFALELIRMQVFSEARIMYRKLNKGRPGELYSTPSLNILSRPSPGQTTGSLLTSAILDADIAGNHFALRKNGKVRRLRPDYMTILLGSNSGSGLDAAVDPEADVVGYLYHPNGYANREDPIPYLASEVAHWAPIPDPLARFRGMSWMTPVLREILADRQATGYKQKFYENGATPNMVIKHQINDPDTLAKWIEVFKDAHEGVANAYKTLHLGGGADVEVVGRDFQQVDFKSVQGAGETRIAAASGVGAVMAQFSEGMAGSSLNAGNYAAARRRVADAVFRPLWRSFCGAYEQIVPIPRNSELWYDERDIAFLREDEKDAAEIQVMRASAIKQLLDAGYTADTVVKAIDNDDMSLLEHSGLFSVQLQPAGTSTPDPEPAPEPDPAPEETPDV
jgi:hypothetical protein